MVDLSEFCGSNALRTSLVKKRAKEIERRDKLIEKLQPIEREIAMYDAMIKAMDEKEAKSTVAMEEMSNEDVKNCGINSLGDINSLGEEIIIKNEESKIPTFLKIKNDKI